MSSDLNQDEELKDLLRQVIAANLTSAYQTEMLRRTLHPTEEKSHPLSQVLDVFETLCEVMEPDDDETDLDVPSVGRTARDETRNQALKSQGSSAPFESTLRYLRPRKR